MMRIRMIPLASREMLRAARWYDRNGRASGNCLLDEIRTGFVSIRELPNAGAPIDAVYRRKLLQTFPYSIVYRVDADAIVVVAIANFKRRPGYWRRRTKAV